MEDVSQLFVTPKHAKGELHAGRFFYIENQVCNQHRHSSQV